MIFVVLGTQKFQLNRLLQKLDEYVEQGLLTDEIYAQIGNSTYKPRHYAYKDFMDKKEFDATIAKADLVIAHSGVGTIITAIHAKKPVVVFPRLAKYKEHVDDHQVQLLKQFDEMNIICSCYEMDDLGKMVSELDHMQFVPYQSNTQTIIEDIEQYLESIWEE